MNDTPDLAQLRQQPGLTTNADDARSLGEALLPRRNGGFEMLELNRKFNNATLEYQDAYVAMNKCLHGGSGVLDQLRATMLEKAHRMMKLNARRC